jgi:response regulator RpfG family c-di-GMP phosphodiesterase
MTAQAPPQERPLVVAIDDDPAVLSALGRLLRDEPYEFVSTTDPDQALDLVRTRRVSLLMADYRMPILSGTGLLQVVKATSPSTIRLIITAYPQSTWVVRAKELEVMEAVVEKPWNEDELKRTIRRRVLGGRPSGTP